MCRYFQVCMHIYNVCMYAKMQPLFRMDSMSSLDVSLAENKTLLCTDDMLSKRETSLREDSQVIIHCVLPRVCTAVYLSYVLARITKKKLHRHQRRFLRPSAATVKQAFVPSSKVIL